MYIFLSLLFFCNLIFSAASDKVRPMSVVEPENCETKVILGTIYDPIGGALSSCPALAELPKKTLKKMLLLPKDNLTYMLGVRLEEYSDKVRECPTGTGFLSSAALRKILLKNIALIHLGADPNSIEKGILSGSQACSTLSIAVASEENTDLLHRLLRTAKADPNTREVLSRAGFSENPDAINLLLDSGMHVDAGFPLHHCISRYVWRHNYAHDHVAITRLWISRGASLNLIDKEGYTPLTKLASCSDTRLINRRNSDAKKKFDLFIQETARLLLSAGADKNIAVLDELPKDRTSCDFLFRFRGKTALEIAQMLNVHPLIEVLQDSQPPVSEQISQ